ncbi:viroplasmin family protein [Bacteroidota bacterium]
MAKQKFYVVWKGLTPGVYTSWDDCKKQIEGYEGAQYKSFKTRELAEKALEGDYHDFRGVDTRILERTDEQKAMYGDPEWISISVDAACSGNPGIMEYRGVETNTNKQLFHQGPFPDATVNVGEFLALVHGLALLQKTNSKLPIYSDSKTAISWVRNKKARTKLEPSSKNKKLFDLIARGENWLRTNTFPNKILKWETKVWGEIPADFGRK